MPAAIRRGSQEPTFERVGTFARSKGDDAVAMFESYGRRYYGSQKYEMRLFMARNRMKPRSRRFVFAARTIGISKPRQNGKSFAARDYALWMACVERKNVLFSAHQGKTVRAMFKEMVDFIEGHEDFRAELKSVYRAAGYESIELADARIDFQTRTTSGGRGGTYSVLIIDEAQELTAAQQDALIPVISAAGEIETGDNETQVIYLGTPPGPECQGTVFKTMHDRAHAGDGDFWWLEWAATGSSIEDIDVDDVDLWYACNPAMGRRMSEAAVRNERGTMTADGFARERLGWWSETAVRVDALIEPAEWDACAVPEAPEGGTVSYGVKFSADGKRVCLAAASKADGRPTHVELVFDEPARGAIPRLAEWLKGRARTCAVTVIDGKAGAQALVEAVERSFPRRALIHAAAGDAVAAAGGLVEAVIAKSVTWYRPEGNGGAQAALRDSALSAVRRPIGTAGGWGIGGDDPTPVEAAALALWGASTTTRDPNRKQEVWY